MHILPEQMERFVHGRYLPGESSLWFNYRGDPGDVPAPRELDDDLPDPVR